MYETFYGFTEKPFNLTPDPKYLYLSPRHTEAFAHLEFGRRERGGFILITGEVGTGKTTLARYFLGRLPANTATAVVLYPALTAAELLRSILDDLHVPVTGTSLKDHVDALHRFLLQARARAATSCCSSTRPRTSSAEVLEQVRLISNLETDTEKLIQIVLMGQSELRRDAGAHRAAPARAARDRALPPGAAVPGRDRASTSATAWPWPAARARSPSPPTRSTPCTSSPPASRASSTSICDRALLAGLRQGPARDQRGHGAPRRAGGPGRAPLEPAFAPLGLGGHGRGDAALLAWRPWPCREPCAPPRRRRLAPALSRPPAALAHAGPHSLPG